VNPTNRLTIVAAKPTAKATEKGERRKRLEVRREQQRQAPTMHRSKREKRKRRCSETEAARLLEKKQKEELKIAEFEAWKIFLSS
jgi:hypothetical protein